MAVDTFNNVTGNWDTAADWSLGFAPGSVTPYDDAEIDAPASVVTVSDTEHVGAVEVSPPFGDSVTIASGGQLLLGGGSSSDDGTFDLANGTLALQTGGTLGTGTANPAVLDLAGGTLAASGGTLNDVRVLGTLDLSATGADLVSTGGLSVASSTGGNGTILLDGNNSTLEIASTETIANDTITFGGANAASSLRVDAGAVLTLSGDTINVNASSASAAASFTGAGKVVLAAGSTLTITPGTANGNNTTTASLTIATGGGLENDGTIATMAAPFVGYATETFSSAITGVGTIDLTNNADFGSTVAAGQTIALQTGAFYTVTLDAVTSGTPNAVQAKITGLVGNNASLLLDHLAFTSTMVGTVANGVLTIKDGSTTDAVFDTPDLANFSRVTLSADGTGTAVTVAAPCYCPGTRIMTAAGEVPVETLAIGDWLVTASGEHRAVRWIGRRSYGGRFVAANPNLQPVRFRAGSLGGGLPRRDLLVSPEHAMFIDGILVPARCLLNGAGIVRERGLDQVVYIHVELDTHDVLLAEGAPSESFMDDDSRFLFHNAAEFATLYPDAAAPAGYCAPRLEHGAELEAIRRRLATVVSAAA